MEYLEIFDNIFFFRKSKLIPKGQNTTIYTTGRWLQLPFWRQKGNIRKSQKHPQVRGSRIRQLLCQPFLYTQLVMFLKNLPFFNHTALNNLKLL